MTAYRYIPSPNTKIQILGIYDFRTQQESLHSIMKNTKIEAEAKQVRLVSPGASFDIVNDSKCKKLCLVHNF